MRVKCTVTVIPKKSAAPAKAPPKTVKKQ